MADLPTEFEMNQYPGRWAKTKQRSGLWRATVANVDDPDRRGRLQVRIIHLHPENSPTGKIIDAPQEQARTVLTTPGQGIPKDILPWAEPAFPFGGGRIEGSEGSPLPPGANQTFGHIMLPPVGSTVWVGFEQGFTGRPVWLGAWLGENELPEEFTDPSNIRLIKTPAGHLILMDDTTDQQKILIATQEGGTNPRTRFVILDDGQATVRMQNSDTQFLEMDADPTTKTTLQDNPTMLLEMDGNAQTAKLTNGSQELNLNVAGGTASLTNGSGSTISMTGDVITITAGVVTMVLDGATGTATITVPTSILLNSSGIVGLGLGAALGVVHAGFKALFDSHRHTFSGSSTSPPESSPGVPSPMVAGVDFSTTVLTKTP